jgi:hypothetical protein
MAAGMRGHITPAHHLESMAATCRQGGSGVLVSANARAISWHRSSTTCAHNMRASHPGLSGATCGRHTQVCRRPPLDKPAMNLSSHTFTGC